VTDTGARQREAAKEAVKAWADAGGQMPDTPMRASDDPCRCNAKPDAPEWRHAILCPVFRPTWGGFKRG
jgi:hypothetical protein